jgi:hypothetical protein
MSLSPIKSIEMIGLLDNCKEKCTHFCIVEYMNKTSHTIKLNSDELINNYWEYLNEPSKRHLSNKNKINELNFNHIYINNICKQSYPCIHECTITLLDNTKIIKYYKGDDIANNFWEHLTEAGKIHFGEFNKNINYSKLSL